MIKKYISLIMVALLPSLAFAEKVLGTLTLATPDTKAICIYDTEAKTATLGNGYTSCINHYEDGELVIPGSVTYQGESYKVVIGQFAFRLCNKLTRVTIGEGVEHIGDYAFVGCSSVTEIRLPATLQTIGAGAFCNLTSLTTMRCMGTTAPTWQWNDVFSVLGTKESMREKSLVRNLFVPAGYLNNYKNSKFDGTSSGTQTRANEKVGWEEAFARIYELSNEPLAITSKAEFIAFRDAVNNGTINATSFKLMADIDLSGEKWTPIGLYGHAFDGIFDGGGHIIKNLNVNHPSTNYQGLFGYATNATIYNMHLLNPKVVGHDYVGSVVGYAYNSSHITDVLVTSNFPSGGDYTVNANSGSGGGIVGYAQDATIERCMFQGRVTCSGWTGGIVGNVYNNVTISDCSASNFLHSFNSDVIGGIVGGAGAVNVNRCFARSSYLWGSVATDNLGKIVGKTNKSIESTITNCAYWIANVDRSVLGHQEGGGTLSASGNEGYNAESDMNQAKTQTVLGTDNWYYFTENYVDYPVPATLKDMYINNCVDVVSGDFVYRPAGDASYEIVKYTGSDASVTIPNTFNEKPVTGIASEVFMDNQTMTSVTIGSNITSIGDRAFYNCDTLTSVSLPNAVTYVGEEAFVGCDELTDFHIGTGFADHKGNFLAHCPKLTTITVADGNANGYISVDNVLIHNTNYGSYIVVCASGKTGDYTIPAESLTENCVWIMNNCFSSCNGLTSITFPSEKWFKLDAAIFDEAYNLRYVDITAIKGFINNDKYIINVTVDRSDPDNPFYGMSDYTMIYLPTGNTANTGEFNVVIGSTADRLSLTENWNFNPRVTPLTVSHGVNFNRSLEANLVEKVTDTDEDIVIDSLTVKKQEGTFEYVATGYTSYLPYTLTLTNENAKVYYPTSSEVVTGVTTITFTEVVNKEMAAFTPYYIVVSGENDVDLSTDENITIVSDTNGSWTVGGYELKGTTTTIPNSTLYDADKPTYILQSDGKWHKVPENQPKAYIGPFRAYFQATTNSGARALNMVIDDGEVTDIQQIRTIDADGTEHYYDMNGRLLSGKPQKGTYIHNGKKYINK
ncbi:leucine-rich repeat domain-containing protein [Prevotella sp. E13-27]|uniref:leucine-rich repeat domain-containing protein n=1 Tax=Prevotella sp. E13-27 TaxID=2938122 RepID=UPI00200AEDF6|nr:leucine-rich repeat domain-containing protein [Prevotella sp. E13-27]MCK8622556.1 leucine-rich repeat protein [Prevotella sp. E13-27]